MKPAEMAGPAINREIAQIDKRLSALGDLLIAAGRGHERFSETIAKGDPLSVEFRQLGERRTALRIEADARYGPGWTPGMRLPGPTKRCY